MKIIFPRRKQNKSFLDIQRLKKITISRTALSEKFIQKKNETKWKYGSSQYRNGNCMDKWVRYLNYCLNLSKRLLTLMGIEFQIYKIKSYGQGGGNDYTAL